MDKKFVVTIGREFGTGGRRIASELAQILGVQLYDRQLLEPLKERYLCLMSRGSNPKRWRGLLQNVFRGGCSK